MPTASENSQQSAAIWAPLPPNLLGIYEIVEDSPLRTRQLLFLREYKAQTDQRPGSISPQQPIFRNAIMIGTSKAEFYFIRACIIGLHYIVPLCVLYCVVFVALNGFQAMTYRFPLLVESIAIAETLFYICVYIPSSYFLQQEAVHPPAPTREERRELFQLCNDNIPDPEAYFQKWFLGAPADEIKRENVKDFFLWAFFNRGGAPGDDDPELDQYVDATEKMLGRPIEEGRGKAVCLRLTLDRVSMLHRSLIWFSVRPSCERGGSAS